ncbi:MAG: phosphoribosyltransferase [Bacillota bacterium]
MYIDRTDAGRALAAALSSHTVTDPLVLAIPRGGVIVGRVLADALGASLDVVMAKKIGAPFNPEYAIAAVDPDGEVLHLEGSHWESVRGHIMEQASLRRRELKESLKAFRQGRKQEPIRGRSVILVDDGLATGLTAMAAAKYIRRQAPKEIILAVPVAPPDTLSAMRAFVDEVVCPLAPRVFHAVGEWYVSFQEVDDQDVATALDGTRSDER